MSTYFNSVVPMSALARGEASSVEWLWHGYLARGHSTLLTSFWKAGKTTLVSGLLRSLDSGEPFLGRACRASSALVVSEESGAAWIERTRTRPLGAKINLLSRPFKGRPTRDGWESLIDEACEWTKSGRLDLFVVDPLASFLPGRSENDSGTMLDVLMPLQRLTEAGAAVLLLHHPRKKESTEGNAARGSGALTGYVDTILEMTRFSSLKSDRFRRSLFVASRFRETHDRLAFEWNPETDDYAVLDNLDELQYGENWKRLYEMLKARKCAAAANDLLSEWPDENTKPNRATLYKWLNRAFGEKKIRRDGKGLRNDPFRFRLEEEADYYHDRGELVPIHVALGISIREML